MVKSQILGRVENQCFRSQIYTLCEFGQTSQPDICFFIYKMVIVIVVCHSVLADSLRPHGLRRARLPCPSPFQTLSKLHMNLLKLTSIELVMSSNHLILCHPLLLLPLIFPSIRVFSNELALCIRWPEYWNFSFSISPSNEYSGLISY